MRRLSVIAAFMLLQGLSFMSMAAAKQNEGYAYPYAQVWASAVRMLRVDLGYPITESDEKAGYILFEHTNQGKKFPGSLELISDKDAHQVQAIGQIPAMPSYVERMLLDRLARKLREDHGEPIAPSPREKKNPAARPKPKSKDLAPRSSN